MALSLTGPLTGHLTGHPSGHLSGPALAATNPCGDGDDVCDAVFDWTGNEQAARAADAFIGKPLALLGIVVFGLVARGG
jgi:hypothetical protein